MYQELKIIESSIKNKIKSCLSTEICSEAGLIPLLIDDSLVELGAMNPDFYMVREIVKEIKSNVDVEVHIKQVAALDWEKWSADQESTTSKTQESEIDTNNYFPTTILCLLFSYR